MRKLADRDLALDRAMIPLGSCTMKLNATAEMVPITWPEFGALHPFAPAEQTHGYRELFEDLKRWLVEITGYDAVSLQPNSGAQGEYAGLLAIRAYHRCARRRPSQGLPDSRIQRARHQSGVGADGRHGRGGRELRRQGNVDLDDLRAKAEKHGANLSALMVTYPSTHGVFEERDPRDLRSRAPARRSGLHGRRQHECAGRLSQPGQFGADVSHLNLHKTFCIPHGGGGPGMGPIGVKAHLAPFLPGHPERMAAPRRWVRSRPHRSVRRRSCRSAMPTS
jgi:glycine dehydrogenase